jgi:hypothetical protein
MYSVNAGETHETFTRNPVCGTKLITEPQITSGSALGRAVLYDAGVAPVRAATASLTAF